MKVPVPMHSHDRTLLASLGFADADKRDRRHSLACQYLATLGSREAILAAFTPWSAGIRAFFELPITKGDGKYRTTIGFVDLVFDAHFTSGDDDGPWVETEWVAVEVKIGPVDVAEVIRQINLYRTYFTCPDERPPALWVVASPSRLTPGDAAMLESSRIRHVLLADKFESWAKAAASDVVPAPSVEI